MKKSTLSLFINILLIALFYSLYELIFILYYKDALNVQFVFYLFLFWLLFASFIIPFKFIKVKPLYLILILTVLATSICEYYVPAKLKKKYFAIFYIALVVQFIYISLSIVFFKRKSLFVKRLFLSIHFIFLFFIGLFVYIKMYLFVPRVILIYSLTVLGLLSACFPLTFPNRKTKYKLLVLVSVFILFLYVVNKSAKQSHSFRYSVFNKTPYSKLFVSKFIKKKKYIRNSNIFPKSLETQLNKQGGIHAYYYTDKEKNKTLLADVKYFPNQKEVLVESKIDKLPFWQNSKKLNGLVLILADTLKASHLPMYGYKRNTSPNLKQFAKENQILLQHSSVYSDTRLALKGIKYSNFFPLRRKRYHQELEKEGVKLQSYSSSRLRKNIRGFKSKKYKMYSVKKITKKAIKYLKAKMKKKEKFVLFLHYTNIHYHYKNHKIKIWGERKKDKYDSEIFYFDNLIKPLLQFMQEKEFKNNYGFIFFGDHGEEHREHQGRFHPPNVYQEIIHVPLIMSFPGNAAFSSTPSNQIDIWPTLLRHLLRKDPKDFTWFEYPRKDLFQLTDKTYSDVYHNSIFSIGHSVRVPLLGVAWSISDKNYKFIYRPYYRIYELYNKNKDPLEKKNLLTPGVDENNLKSYSWETRQAFYKLANLFRYFYKYTFLRKKKSKKVRFK